jgi:ABC-2 type transport system permease protein
MISKTSTYSASAKGHLLLGFVPFFQKELQAWKYEKQAAIALLFLIPSLLWITSALIIRFIAWQTGRSAPIDLTLTGSFFANTPLWIMLVTLLLSIGIIPKEMEQGTLAWNLTKPLSRAAFLLGKWAAYSLMIWFVSVVLVSFIGFITTVIILGWATPNFGTILSSQVVALCAIGFWVLVCILFGLLLKDQAAVMAGAIGLGLVGFLLPNVSMLSSFIPSLNEAAQETLKFVAQLYPSNTLDWLTNFSAPFKSIACFLYMSGMAIAAKFIFDRKEYS